MKNKKQVIEIFKQWGKDKQRDFTDKDDIKTHLLNSLIGASTDKARVWRSWPWLKIGVVAGACAVLLILVLPPRESRLLYSLPQTATDYQASGNPETISSPSSPSVSKEITSGDLGISNSGSASSYEPIGYWNQYPDVSYQDRREYLKVYYQATMQTRKVDTIANQVQTTVRGYSGRIDSSSLTEKTAYVSFVIPKKSFEAFRTEIKNLVGKKFTTEIIGSQNLLPQKTSIEEQTKTASSSLVDYQSQKKDLFDKHGKTVAGYQSQLNYYGGQIWSARQELKSTTSTSRQAELQTQISLANGQWSRIKKLIDSENSNYNKEAAVLDGQIKVLQGQLSNLKIQDTNLVDNVETVQGTIMINWISYWELIKLYVPFYKWLLAGVMLIVILIAIFGGHRRSFAVV